MDTLNHDIDVFLRRQKTPVSARDIAEAVATPADAAEIRSLLGIGVKRGKYHRHHSPEGLRYSFNREPQPEREPARHIVRRPEDKASRRSRRPAIKRDRILEVLGDRRMSARQIHDALDGAFTIKQVSNLLTQASIAGLAMCADGYWKKATARAPVTATTEGRFMITIMPVSVPVHDTLLQLMNAIQAAAVGIFEMRLFDESLAIQLTIPDAETERAVFALLCAVHALIAESHTDFTVRFTVQRGVPA
jgi:hypothetical protein